jgi:hypothetical protein
MADLADDLVTVIGFDITEEKALQWLNERQKQMAVRAEAFTRTLTLTPTDGTDATVTLPVEVARVKRIRIAGQRYDPVARDVIEDLRAGRAVIPSVSRAYSVEADADARDTLEVYPTPAADQVVELLAVIRPDDLGPTDTPLVPDDFVGALVEGAAATGYAFDPEQTTVADRYEQRFDAKCAEYRAWARGRARGDGPRQIRVQGLNA